MKKGRAIFDSVFNKLNPPIDSKAQNKPRPAPRRKECGAVIRLIDRSSSKAYQFMNPTKKMIAERMPPTKPRYFFMFVMALIFCCSIIAMTLIAISQSTRLPTNNEQIAVPAPYALAKWGPVNRCGIPIAAAGIVAKEATLWLLDRYLFFFMEIVLLFRIS